MRSHTNRQQPSTVNSAFGQKDGLERIFSLHSPLIHLNVATELPFQDVFTLFERGAGFRGEVGVVPQAAGDPAGGLFALCFRRGIVQRSRYPVFENVLGGLVHPGLAGAEVGENRLPVAEIPQRSCQTDDDASVLVRLKGSVALAESRHGSFSFIRPFVLQKNPRQIADGPEDIGQMAFYT